MAIAHERPMPLSGPFDAASDELRDREPVVFVVDDDAVTLSLLCEIASEAGWNARGFTRLGELRRAIDDAAPSLFILDDDLPDGRGGDLARELREDPRLRNVPTLVCTAAHPMRQAEIGAWAPVISKPFRLAALDRLLADAHPDARRARAHRAG
jgi:DNA-binding response OmpR family regulator